MDYNYSNAFGFLWNASSPYVVPGFNNTSNLNVFNNNGQQVPSINPYSQGNPAFGNPLLFHSARFPANGIPFGINNSPFGPQMTSSAGQNAFSVQIGMETFQVQSITSMHYPETRYPLRLKLLQPLCLNLLSPPKNLLQLMIAL